MSSSEIHDFGFQLIYYIFNFSTYIIVHISSCIQLQFAGNFHKWVYCARGSAALWVHPKHHGYVKPVVTGHSYRMDRWRDEFSAQGTLDHTPFMVTKDAIQFYQDMGGKVSSLHNTRQSECQGNGLCVYS